MKFLLTLLSIFTMSVYASDFEYTIAGDFSRNGHALSIQNDLPADFLDKEQAVEKEFEITELSPKENGKYKVEFNNSTEPAPIKKVVILLSKLNSKTGKFENLSTNFYFFKDTKFWFVGRTFLSPKDSLNIGISNKSLWKAR